MAEHNLDGYHDELHEPATPEFRRLQLLGYPDSEINLMLERKDHDRLVERNGPSTWAPAGTH